MYIIDIRTDVAFKILLSLEEKFIHVGEETASYYTQRPGDVLNIYFEWSNGKTDWLNNFDFPAAPYRDMKDGRWFAHRGFLRVWKAIEPCIKEQIKDTSVKGINIFGYSHGGAIALLCHEYCRFNRPDVTVLGYGFGAPRVIWGPLGKKVRERFDGFVAIRCGRDIVTHVPPAIFGYWHPYLCRIDTEKAMGFNAIDAHRPESYLEILKKFSIEICAPGESVRG